MSDNTGSHIRSHLSRQAKWKIYSSTIVAVILVLTVGQPHAGFLLLALALPFVVWLTYSAYVIVKHPYARLAQIICIIVWMLALALVAGIHLIWHQAARRDANQVVSAIVKFSSTHRRCPKTLGELGIKRDSLSVKLGDNFRYSCIERKPEFFYEATFTIFDTFAYDFEKGIWRYESWADKKEFLDTRTPVLKNRPIRKPAV